MNLESKSVELARASVGSELLNQITMIEDDEELYMESIKDSLEQEQRTTFARHVSVLLTGKDFGAKADK